MPASPSIWSQANGPRSPQPTASRCTGARRPSPARARADTITAVDPSAGALGARLADGAEADDVGGEAARHGHARVDERAQLAGRLGRAFEPPQPEVECVAQLPHATAGEAGVGGLTREGGDAVDV